MPPHPWIQMGQTTLESFQKILIQLPFYLKVILSSHAQKNDHNIQDVYFERKQQNEDKKWPSHVVFIIGVF